MVEPHVRIPINTLLRGTEQTLGLEEALALRLVVPSMASVSEQVVGAVHATYGPSGLFQLVLLATAHSEEEFGHFHSVVQDCLAIEHARLLDPGVALRPDNASLRQSAHLAKFMPNVMQPSLARKLYRVGRHHGSLVYGLGGPRVLVSHPFRGATDSIYDVYVNSLDVVTSLVLLGYGGAFHFLDLVPGLDYEVEGEPAWVLWFSIIAAHSDLVIFLTEEGRDFSPSQQLEIDFTPDRVNKKIVELPGGELRWATKADTGGAPMLYVGETGVMSEAEWHAMEARHAAPFIENYVDPGAPTDQMIILDEEGSLHAYPLDYPAYQEQSP